MPVKKGKVASKGASDAPRLFSNERGHPLVFYIPPCGERQDLRSRIEAGGGAITLLQGGPCVLHIVPKQGARERREPIAPDCVAVSSRFIYRCSDEKELLPLDNFILQDGKLDRYLSPQPLGGETLQQEPQPRPLKRPAAADSVVGVSDPAVAPMKRPAAAAAAVAVAVAPATAAASGAAAPEALPARLRFNAAEDDALVRWAKSNPQMRAKGEKLWKAAERAGITPHCWESMQNRYRRQLATPKASLPAPLAARAAAAKASAPKAKAKATASSADAPADCAAARGRGSRSRSRGGRRGR
ncbi:unnamed protein product [Polarella glacialis]|uniref:Telomeric repeat-binding factor 2-interacting protein 1 n=1 Tax=Polarella glacialis TaxID=89957 RepID=A0A813HNN2_POLGL|nr:unnamed protein product [Polarella glacialis]